MYVSAPSDEGPEFWEVLIHNIILPLSAIGVYLCHAQALQNSCPKKEHPEAVLCYSLYDSFILCLPSDGTRMDQLKSAGSQDLTHPLEYNKEQVHTLQKEKVMHSKFKGTARVTGESVKSEETQVSCLLWNKYAVLFNEYLSVQASYGNIWILPFVTGGWLFMLLLEDGCVYSKDIFVITEHCFGLCFKCTSCYLYIREKICWSAQSILYRREQGPSIPCTSFFTLAFTALSWLLKFFCLLP